MEKVFDKNSGNIKFYVISDNFLCQLIIEFLTIYFALN